MNQVYMIPKQLIRDTTMSRYAITVYEALAMFNQSGVDNPTIKQICTFGRVSTRLVFKTINELEKSGWLKVDRSSGERSKYTVLYKREENMQ